MYTNTFLETTNWDNTTEGQQPARLPDSMNKPNIRREVLNILPNQTCNLCTGKFQSQFHHCSNPTKTAQQKIIMGTRQPTQTIPQVSQQKPVNTSHGRTQSNEANYFLLQRTQETYCTNRRYRVGEMPIPVASNLSRV
jgi:hypothetical protein